MHLKMIGNGVGGIEWMIDGFSKKDNGWMDGQMDQPTGSPSYRDERTHLKMKS